MAETLAQLSKRVDELERVLLDLVRSAKRNEIQAAVAPLQARKDRRDGAAEYEIGSLIG